MFTLVLWIPILKRCLGQVWRHICVIAALRGTAKLRSAWSTQQVPSQPGPHSETLSQDDDGGGDRNRRDGFVGQSACTESKRIWVQIPRAHIKARHGICICHLNFVGDEDR